MYCFVTCYRDKYSITLLLDTYVNLAMLVVIPILAGVVGFWTISAYSMLYTNLKSMKVI